MVAGIAGLTLAKALEYGLNLAIFFVAIGLAYLSWLAYRRNREEKLRYVSVAFGLFAVKGFLVFIEPFLIRQGLAYQAEIIEHAGASLILVGLIMFFLALSRD